MLYIFLAVVILPAFLISALRFSFVQSFLTNRLASYLSGELHTKVSVGGVEVTFLLNIELEDVVINDLHNNPLINAKSILINIHDIYLRKKLISIEKVILEKTDVNIRKYKGEKEANFKFIADYFSSKDTTTSKKKPWRIWLGTLILADNHFTYQNQNIPFTNKGIDFNNLDFAHLNTRLDNFVIDNGSLFANIRLLSFIDRSGFTIKSLSAKAKIESTGITIADLKLETPGSYVSMNCAFNFKSFADFNDLMNKVKIEVTFKPSRIDMKDMAYFIPAFRGMDNIINVSGEIKGKISDLNGKNFQLLYGKSTYFMGNFEFTGLPDIEGTYIHFHVRSFYTSQRDLQAFKLPSEKSVQHLQLPDELVRLGNIKFRGEFTGFYNDFVATGDFYTDMGKISTDITLRKNRTTYQLEYDGKLETTNLNIGNILAMPDQLGFITMNADVTGSGFDPDNATIKMKGTIAAIDYRKYHYSNIEVRGELAKKKFNGYVSVNDKNVNLDFTGTIDYSGKLPVVNINSKIENLRMSRLHFMELTGDSMSSFSTNLELNFEGNNIDNIQGTIHATNTSFIYKGETYELDNLKFTNTSDSKGNKTLNMTSDYLDADISGNFMFRQLYRSSLKFLKVYLPSYSTWIKDNLDTIPDQNFVYSVRFKNTAPLSKLLMPELAISANTILKGTYNTRQSLLDMNITSPMAMYKKYILKDLYIKGKTKDSKIIISVGCQHLNLSDSARIDNITLNSMTRNDSLHYHLSWDNNNNQVKNSGDIKGFLSFYKRPQMELKFNQAKLVINDSTWNIDKGNDITFDSSSIKINNLVFTSGNQQLSINGGVSQNPEDVLHISFSKFNVSSANRFIASSGYNFNGNLDGSVDVSNVYKSLNIVSNVVIDDFYINKEKYGKAVMKTVWNSQQKAAAINMDIIYEGKTKSSKIISVFGNFYPERKTDNFDINIKLDSFKLHLLNHYFSGFTSNLKGYATGNLKLRGPTSDPELSGRVKALVKNVKFDYLNETYSFNDSITISKSEISFDHLVLKDTYGDTAVCDGKIMHKKYRDFSIDIFIHPYHFQCLNTDAAQNSLYYGKAFVTGLVRMSGSVDNITIDVNATTNKNTHLYVPIASESDISDNDYIKFINKKSYGIRKDVYKPDLSGIQLHINLDVTHDAEVQIMYDSKNYGDIIKAKGSGDIRMEVTTLGDFNMYGNYAIDEGDYLFSLRNLVNKKFIIQQGSTIKFNGNPYDGIADINATYLVRTDLLPLFKEENSKDSATYSKRIEVNCLLSMKDKILNPTLSFDIDLPNSDDDTKTLVKSAIPTDEDMNKQVFSLLIMNSFIAPNNKDYGSYVSNGFSNTSTELLSNQLNNWLSQISKKFDVGVNYRPGTQMTSDEIRVALGTQLFNDRLSVDGNFGTSGTSNTSQGNAQKTSNIVGDVNLEYKLTKDGHLRVKGYNKSNTVDLLNSNAPYTQGVGIIYSREFDALIDLFRREKTTDALKLKK